MEENKGNELTEMMNKIRGVTDALHHLTLNVMEVGIANAAEKTDSDIERYKNASFITRFYWKRKMVKSIERLNRLIEIYNEYARDSAEDDKQKSTKDMP